MSFPGPKARLVIAQAVSHQTNSICGIPDDVKLLIVNRLHSLDDYYRLMVTNNRLHVLLEMNRCLVTEGIIVGMNKQLRSAF